MRISGISHRYLPYCFWPSCLLCLFICCYLLLCYELTASLAGITPGNPSHASAQAIAFSVYFERDSARIRPEFFSNLDTLGRALTDKKLADVGIAIEGHTDSNGPEDYNRLLSDLRATSVKEYLVKKYNIDPQRLVTRAYGADQPIASNDTPAGRRKNRRIEVVNLGDTRGPLRRPSIDVFGEPRIAEFINNLEALEGSTRWSAAKALGKLGVYARTAVPALIKVVQGREGPDRWAAVEALGFIGADAQTALPVLVLALRDYGGTVYTVRAIARIASHLAERADVLTLTDLEYIISVLKNARKAIGEMKTLLADSEGHVSTVHDAFDTLMAQRAARKGREALRRLLQVPGVKVVLIAVIYSLLLLFLWLILLWFKPVWLIQLDERLATSALKPKLKYVDAPARYLLGLAFVVHRPRVLDAWVNQYLPSARRHFEQTETVQRRRAHIQMPVAINGVAVPEPTGKSFRELFTQRKAVLLIKGEGGIGKTSLACQLAWWAMSDDPKERLCQHPMLPLLFEYGLPTHADGRTLSLTEAIRGKLMDVLAAESALSVDLVTALLRKRRILVIIDGMSESGEGSRRAVVPTVPTYDANALIVTSRIEERLGGVVKWDAQPLRLRGQRVSFFIEAYLALHGKQDLYEQDEELFETCRQLTRLVADSEVTVLLAKLFVDQAIATKEGYSDVALPQNIPELMLGYVNLVNAPNVSTVGGLSNDKVRHAAKCVAWACVERTLYPSAAEEEHVLQSLGGGEEARLQLDTLKHCGIIQILPPLDRIRFTLDPLAEYLAALYLVELYSNKEARESKAAWHDFLEQTYRLVGASEAIPGFLQAVQDCCEVKGQEAQIPGFVLRRLRQWAHQAA